MNWTKSAAMETLRGTYIFWSIRNIAWRSDWILYSRWEGHGATLWTSNWHYVHCLLACNRNIHQDNPKICCQIDQEDSILIVIFWSTTTIDHCTPIILLCNDCRGSSNIKQSGTKLRSKHNTCIIRRIINPFAVQSAGSQPLAQPGKEQDAHNPRQSRWEEIPNEFTPSSYSHQAHPLDYNNASLTNSNNHELRQRQGWESLLTSYDIIPSIVCSFETRSNGPILPNKRHEAQVIPGTQKIWLNCGKPSSSPPQYNRITKWHKNPQCNRFPTKK